MSTLVLKATNDGFYYNQTGRVAPEGTNLPFGAFRFSERAEHYWEVKMVAYDRNTASLRVQGLDLEAGAGSFDPQRQPKAPIHRLIFEPLPAEPFKAQLASYRLGELSAVLAPDPAPSTNLSPASAPELEVESTATRPVTFRVPLTELTFRNGGVTGTADLTGLNEPLPFRIRNDHILTEFDAIKSYFVRALKRRTVEVSTTLIFAADGPRLAPAASPQIARIDESMLRLFRGRALRSLTNAPPPAVDKSLFTPDDLLGSLEDHELGRAVLPDDGLALLDALLAEKDVRNARQLRFLAGRLHDPGQQLHYVLSPGFGFVFTARGQDANHYVLELLDSHATYVWSIPRDWGSAAEQVTSVEREIAMIGNVGRSQYRRTLHFEHEFWFVVHERAEAGLSDGFPRWKNRLLEGIV